MLDSTFDIKLQIRTFSFSKKAKLNSTLQRKLCKSVLKSQQNTNKRSVWWWSSFWLLHWYNLFVFDYEFCSISEIQFSPPCLRRNINFVVESEPEPHRLMTKCFWKNSFLCKYLSAQQRIKIIKIIFTKLQFSLVLQGSDS